MRPAPIIVFAYKRPDKLQQALHSLAANALAAQSELFIFCDGPKPGAKPEDLNAIERVRELARNTSGFARTETIEAEKNKGLARSVIDGVTAIVDRFGKVIIVEEDTLVSPHFLDFMNEATDLYEQDDRVFGVGAWNYFVDPAALKGNFFLRYPDSQSWATWKRSWDLFDKDGERLWQQLEETGRMRALDGDGGVTFFSEMLRAQIRGKIDSWAIRWTANCVLQGKVCIYPRFSLVRNMGVGEAGATHESDAPDHNRDLRLADAPVVLEPQPVVETPEAFAGWVQYARRNFQGTDDPTLKDRIWRMLPVGVKRMYKRSTRS